MSEESRPLAKRAELNLGVGQDQAGSGEIGGQQRRRFAGRGIGVQPQVADADSYAAIGSRSVLDAGNIS